MGAWKNTIEKVIRDGEPIDGFREDQTFSIASWLGLGTSPPAIATLGTTPNLVRVWGWANPSTTTGVLQLQIPLPGNYARYLNDFKLLVWARKQYATSETTATTKLRATVRYFKPGTDTANTTLTTPVDVALPTAVDASGLGAFTGWSELSFDLGAALASETKNLPSDDSYNLAVQLSPDGTVGANDTIYVMGMRLRWRRHASLRSKAARYA